MRRADDLGELTRVRTRLERQTFPEAGTIPAFIHQDPGVFALEQERVFAQAWLFVGHDSEIPRPGDYVTRAMGNDSVVLCRGEDGQVRVFLNACRHRGMRVCRSDLGNTSHFRCPYHGFTYRNTGELIGVPYQQDAFGDVLRKSELGLLEAKVESYGGLWFATRNPEPMPLLEYLGDMRWYLDFLCGRDDMEVVGPPQRRRVPTGWKLPSENFMSDAYHTSHSHASIHALGLAPRRNFSETGYQIYAGQGHGLGLGYPAESCVFPDDLLPVFQERLGAKQYQIIQHLRNIHGLVFPNLGLQISPVAYHGRLISHTDLFVFNPISPTEIEIWSWLLMDRHASEEWKALSQETYVLTFSASGIFDQDDIENFSDMTQNIGHWSASARSNVYQMGLGRPLVTDFPGPGSVYRGKFCAANARGFYRHWLDLLLKDGQ